MNKINKIIFLAVSAFASTFSFEPVSLAILTTGFGLYSLANFVIATDLPEQTPAQETDLYLESLIWAPNTPRPSDLHAPAIRPFTTSRTPARRPR